MMGRRTRSGVPFKSSLALLWAFFAMAALLSGCAPIDRQQARVRAWWAALTGTASGTLATVREGVVGTVEAGKQAVQGVEQTVENVSDRAVKVKEGSEKIQEGKKLIEEGVGRGE